LNKGNNSQFDDLSFCWPCLLGHLTHANSKHLHTFWVLLPYTIYLFI